MRATSIAITRALWLMREMKPHDPVRAAELAREWTDHLVSLGMMYVDAREAVAFARRLWRVTS